MSNPPPGQVLALRFDSIMGKNLSGDLSVLLYALANACANVAEDERFALIQKYATSFLFDEGRQALRVILSNQGKDVDIQHSVDQMTNVFPLTQKFGDMDILFQFRPNAAEAGKASESNELRVGVGLVGVAPIEVVASKFRRSIALVTNNGETNNHPKQMAQSVLEAMLQLFPNGHQFLTDLFNMDTFELLLKPRDGATFVEVDVDFNISKLEKLYPAVGNWLRHVQDLDFSVLDMHEKGSQPENDLESAPCFFRLGMQYNGGWVRFTTSFLMSSAESGTLLWFNQADGSVVKGPDGQPRVVDLNEGTQGHDSRFRVVLRNTIRLHELGCGTFSLPLIILKLTISSSPVKFPHLYAPDINGASLTPAHRFDLKMLYVGDKRLTSVFIRPFFNLNAFRDMLMRDFHLEIEFVPSTNGQHDYFNKVSSLASNYDMVAGHWSMIIRLKLNVVNASSVLVSFFRMFATVQLANPDDLRFWWQIATTLHRDLKLMHGRLARAEGATPSFELSNAEQTVFRHKQKAKARAKSRCVIS